MRVLNLLADLCSLPGEHKRRNKQLQTVELKVRMDCEGCEKKVRKALEGMEGVSSIEVDPKQHRVAVTGYVEPRKVAERVERRTGKKAEPWPYVPYAAVARSYAPGAYDEKAPPGYVRNVADDDDPALASASSAEVKYAAAFSDDNPNSCIVM